MIGSAMPFSSELRAGAQAGAMKASRPSAAADFVTCRRVTPAAPAKGFGRVSRTARVLSVFVSRLGKWRARRAARARWMRREGDGTAAADRPVRSDATQGPLAAATADWQRGV